MKWFILILIFASILYNSDKTTDMITNARKAAILFCEKNNFPSDKVHEISKKPIVSVDTKKDEHAVHIYRWLGGGRGDSYVQVEVFKDKQEMVVYGSDGKKEFEPETYPFENGL